VRLEIVAITTAYATFSISVYNFLAGSRIHSILVVASSGALLAFLILAPR
jgi:hypothetical protein